MKKLNVLLTVLLAVCLLAGCHDSGTVTQPQNTAPVTEPQPEIKISISENQATVGIGGTLFLTAQTENTTENVVWASSDITVATVTDGEVTALKEGTTVISASVGSVRAECTVVVSGSAPALTVSDSYVALDVGGSYTVTASVTMNGVPYTEHPVAYTWMATEGSEGFVSLQADTEGSATFTGVSYGNAEYFVTAQVNGVTLTKRVQVVCWDGSVVMNPEGAGVSPVVGGFSLRLELGKTARPSVTVYSADEKVNNPKISWTSDRPGIAQVSGNGTITGLKEGSAVITAKYGNNNNHIRFFVQVYRPIYTMKTRYTIENTVGTLTLTDTLEGTIQNVTLNGRSVLDSVNGSIITLKADALPTDASLMGEGRPLTVETDRASYHYSVNVYSKIITTAQEFQNMASYLTRKAGDNNWAKYDGYLILGNDIDLQGAAFDLFTAESYDGGTRGDGHNAEAGFVGVLDGKGYCVKNYTATPNNNGLFTTVGKSGVIQNLNLLDMTAPSGTGTILTNMLNGKLQDLYITIAKWDSGNFMSHPYRDGRYLQNIVVEYTGGHIDGLRDFTGHWGTANYYPHYPTYIQNVYLVGDISNLFTNCAEHGSSLPCGFHVYNSVDELISAGNRYNSFTADKWNTSAGMPVPVRLFNQWSSTDISVTNPTVEGQYELSRGSTMELTANVPYVTWELVGSADGVTLTGNKLTAQADAGAQQVTVKASNLYDSEKTVEITVYLVNSENKTLEKLDYLELMGESDQPYTYVDLKENQEIKSIISVSINGRAAERGSFSLEGNRLKLGTEQLAQYLTKPVSLEIAYKAGEKNIIAACEVEMIVTKAIKSFADLQVLNSVKTPNLDGHYILANDIDAENQNIAAGSSWGSGFKGTFDGRNHTISNLKLGDGALYSGIFGAVNGGTIKNITFSNVQIGSRASLFGRVIGNVAGTTQKSHVENVTVNISAWASNAYESGVFTFTSMANTVYTNVTVNVADGVKVENLLGRSLTASNVEGEIVVNLGIDSSIVYYNDTSAVKPDFVTVNKSVAEEVTDFFAGEKTTKVILGYKDIPPGEVSVTINGQTKPLSVTEDGDLTVDLADFGVSNMGRHTVVVTMGKCKYTFTDVWYVTQVIDTVAELKALGAACKTANTTGYYILGGDIDCSGEANMAVGNPGWEANGFSGTFDGRDHKISNIKLIWDNPTGGYGGLFGNLDGCTIKNVTFDKVNYASVNVALLGRHTYKNLSSNNTVLENLTVNISDWKATGEAGVFVSRSSRNTLYNNITVNVAEGVFVHNLLGQAWNSNYGSGITVELGEGSKVTAFYWTGTADSTAVTQPPSIVTIDMPAVEETSDSLVAAENTKTLVISNAGFTQGNAAVTINGQTKTVAITQNGKLTVNLGDFGVTAMGRYNAVVETASGKYTYNDVWYVTQVIDTVAELKALGARCKSANITGYYILGADIDCSGEANMAVGNPGWLLNGFSGTFDGRGKKISNIKMTWDSATGGYGGLFGNLLGAIIKNVTFDKVNYASANVTLLGRHNADKSQVNTVIENVTVNISAWNATGEAGVFASRGTLNTLYNNVTIHVANGVKVHNLLGQEWRSNHGTGITVTLGTGSAITAYYWTGTADTTAVTTKPTIVK